MKIAMILDAPFPPDPRVENEAIALVQGGHEVFLFCLSYGEEKGFQEIHGINVHRFQSNTLEYKLSALAYTFPFYSILMQKKLNKFLKITQPGAIHIHDIRIAGAVFSVNKHFKLPVILDLHDNYPEVMQLYPHLQKFPGKYLISPKKWKLKEEEFIRKSTKIISVSPHFVKNLKERIPAQKDNFVLVPNTIREAFYKEYHVEKKIIERYSKNFVMLYLGDTHLRRGLQTAIESIPILKDNIPSIKLVIVGKNTTDYVLKQLVVDLNIEEYVDFEGWQDVSLFQSYILASNLCISPLHRNLQHDVAYANKLFQYMSFGKPLLVSNATAQKELVQEHKTGLVHEAKNKTDFASKVLELYKKPDLRAHLGKNGECFVKDHFTWDKTSKALISIYDNLES